MKKSRQKGTDLRVPHPKLSNSRVFRDMQYLSGILSHHWSHWGMWADVGSYSGVDNSNLNVRTGNAWRVGSLGVLQTPQGRIRNRFWQTVLKSGWWGCWCLSRGPQLSAGHSSLTMKKNIQDMAIGVLSFKSPHSCQKFVSITVDWPCPQPFPHRQPEVIMLHTSGQPEGLWCAGQC